jgi:hypothetical protein
VVGAERPPDARRRPGLAWYDRPFTDDGQSNRLASIAFDLQEGAFAAWTLVAFAIGGLAGILIRRVWAVRRRAA